MKIDIPLLAGASMGALALAATPAAAKPVRHHAHATAAASDGTAAEIKALREEVEALKARLDDQENQQSQTQAVAVQAQVQAQQAQTQAATAQQAVPDEVKTALAAQPKPKPQWFDNTSVSGRMYFNFSTIRQSVNGVRPAGEPNGYTNGTGFNIKRMYLTVDHTFDKTFSASVTMDAANVVGRTSNGDFNAFNAPAAPGGAISDAQLVGRGFFIKKAYLQAKISPALIIRAGSADMPWIPYVEGIYGYRHIENTLIDRASFGTSADWGIHVLGDLAGGLFSYQLSAIDGGGFRNVRVTKSVDFEGRVSMNYKHVFAGVGGYTGKLAQDAQSTPTFHTAERLNATAGFKNELFTVGGEYFWAKNYNNNGVNYITTDVRDKSRGYSGFASVNFAKHFSVFGRYDHIEPRRDALPELKETYYNAGIQWSPVKIVDLAIVYKHDRAHDGTITTSNGTIGGLDSGKYNEIGLFGQFRF